MPEILLTLDRQILFLINQMPHNLLTDSFFLFFSVAGVYGIIWFLLALLLVIFDGLDNRREITALLLAVLIEVLAVEIILKNAFLRIRPESAFTDIVRVLERVNIYSFPSGHATIAFASAIILTRQRKKLKWFFYTLAFLTAVSRIYLGRHYPSDVLVGAISGLFIGNFSFKMVEKNVKFKK